MKKGEDQEERSVQGQYYRNQVVDAIVVHPIITVTVLACEVALQVSEQLCSVV
jgi:hypothetical protein